ncbi:MAG: hypothetical protein HY301_15745 [Verrucomicrobia bacterium]|nr:hypothetical protein [Verrucomicrobiota bacterium]
MPLVGSGALKKKPATDMPNSATANSGNQKNIHTIAVAVVVALLIGIVPAWLLTQSADSSPQALTTQGTNVAHQPVAGGGTSAVTATNAPSTGLMHSPVSPARGLAIYFMAALGCCAAGVLFGFLFGIPHGEPESKPAPNAAGAKESPGLRDSTNLEQVSDWLVKLLLGAGLVQMKEIRSSLVRFAEYLAKCLGNDGCVAFIVLLIIYYLIVGFLGAYLLTKLFWRIALTEADKDARAIWDKQLEAAKLAGTVDSEPLPAKGVGAALVQKLKNLTSLSAVAVPSGDDADPHKGKFGGKAEAGGRRLTAKVTKADNIDDDYFLIHLEVATTGGKPLASPVTFHLHPTFHPSMVSANPVNGIASLDRLGWGAFTVGAVTDEGETRLELDLVDVPGVPALFASR